MKFLIPIFILLYCFVLQSCSNSDSEDYEFIPFFAISEKPKVVGFEEYPFGVAVNYAIAENLVYPENAKEQSIEGKVFTQFDIDVDGYPIELRIVKDTSEGVLGNSALEAVRKIRFEPSFQNGNRVGLSNVTVPITFRLK